MNLLLCKIVAGGCVLQITVMTAARRRAGEWVRSAFPQHKAAAHDSFSQTQTAEDGLDNGHSTEPGNQEAGGPNSEEQVSHWKAELASLSWRMLGRFWCRFCPQFGFRSPGTVSTKTNAPCHFPRRWAMFPFKFKRQPAISVVSFPIRFPSLLFLFNVYSRPLWRTGFLDVLAATNKQASFKLS